MDCEDVRGRLLAYRERQLDRPTQTRLEAHLLVCEHCLRELRDLETLLAALTAAPIPEPSPAAISRLRMRIAAERARGRQGWPQWFAWRPGFAMAGLLAVVAGTAAGPGVWSGRGATAGRDLERPSLSAVSNVDGLLGMEAALRLWRAPFPEGEVLDAFVGLMELPDGELEELLIQLRG